MSDNYDPALPSGHPFINVQYYYTDCYWSSTTRASSTSYAWRVYMDEGDVGTYYKTSDYYVWPVRGGN
jgi:hypothetical protein